MSVIVALDTNVLLYAIDRSVPDKREAALKLIAESSGAVLLWQVAVEFVAATRKLAKQGFTPKEAWEQLGLYQAAMPLLMPSPAVLERARELHLRHQVSLWDSMLIAAALDAGAERLYSEDVPGAGSAVGLQIVNPFQ